jgi:DNA-binding response OmpR family regulator
MILIVEDDAVLGDVFARGLRAAGYEVAVATTADQGLAKAKAGPPAAIVLDFRMPLMNGLGFLYRLRAAETGRRTPVVVVTGEAPLADDVQGQFDELGAHVRFKPITPKQLIETIRLALGEVIPESTSRRIAR